jgi:hypothetical protein
MENMQGFQGQDASTVPVSGRRRYTAVTLQDDEIIDYGRVVDVVDGVQVGRDCGITNSEASCVFS